MRRAAVLLLVLPVLLAGCGGHGQDAATATPTLRAARTATSAPPATPAPSAVPTAGPSPASPPTASPPLGAATVIRRIDTTRNSVVLTFDAGSDAGHTSQILDTLAANGITAAFGISGRWAEENPDLLRRIVQEGHTLVNHSYDHPSFTGLSTGETALTRGQRWQQLDRTEAAVQRLAGATTLPYFRPPFGDYDDSVNADVAARGYSYNVMWTVDSMGWKGLSADAIVKRCLSLAAPGAVYVFHVGSASQDGPALQRLIDDLRDRGHTFAALEAP